MYTDSLTCCYFTDYVAFAGGAIHSMLGNSGIEIGNCEFVQNIAAQRGGAIYFGEKHVSIDLSASIVDGNRAAVGGGKFHFSKFNRHVL